MKKNVMVSLLIILMLPLTGYAFSDISESPYKEEIKFFKAEGIINGKGDGKFHPQDKLTRAETAKLCAGIVPYKYFEETKLVFSDVLFEHWAVKEIGVMVYTLDSLTPEYTELLLLNHNDRLFYPERKVTAKYFLDACLEILGYKPKAEEKDIGYEDTMKKAKECGLLKEIEVKADEEITREEAIKILHNTINSPVVIAHGMTYDSTLGKYITNAKVMDGSSEETPLMTLWMYKNK